MCIRDRNAPYPNNPYVTTFDRYLRQAVVEKGGLHGAPVDTIAGAVDSVVPKDTINGGKNFILKLDKSKEFLTQAGVTPKDMATAVVENDYVKPSESIRNYLKSLPVSQMKAMIGTRSPVMTNLRQLGFSEKDLYIPTEPPKEKESGWFDWLF